VETRSDIEARTIADARLARLRRLALARHYANVIDDYADAPLIDPEQEVRKARRAKR